MHLFFFFFLIQVQKDWMDFIFFIFHLFKIVSIMSFIFLLAHLTMCFYYLFKGEHGKFEHRDSDGSWANLYVKLNYLAHFKGILCMICRLLS